MAEVLGERRPVPLRRIGYQDVWPQSGSISQIFERYRLRPMDIAAAAREAIAAREADLGGADQRVAAELR